MSIMKNLVSRMVARFRQMESKKPSDNIEKAVENEDPPLKAHRDPYRGVVLVLLAAVFFGTLGAIAGVLILATPVLLDVAVTLGLSTVILFDIMLNQMARARSSRPENEDARITALAHLNTISGANAAGTQPEKSDKEALNASASTTPSLSIAPVNILSLFLDFGLGTVKIMGVLVVTVGLIETSSLSFFRLPAVTPTLIGAGMMAFLCLCGVGLAANAARFFSGVESRWLPEGQKLCQWARLVAWILVLAAVSAAFALIQIQPALMALHYVVLAINIALSFSLQKLIWADSGDLETFSPTNFSVLSVLGSRANILASIADTVEKQFGIDLRSTWALTVVRSSIEPLLIALSLLGWLSTSLTVIGIQDQGLIERLGVPIKRDPLMPGLHLHWPWPIDRVSRVPMQRVHDLEVGHEGEEGGGPENVLWAVEHAPNEYTLLLGNGRDLITVDAAVQYRITDLKAWLYHSQNPTETLKAIAYRAVMRSTVNRTLSQTLSENLTALTEEMRKMVQSQADALGLGVEIIAFTVGGMHPPVPVAADYEAVVSAELGKVTAAVNAQAFRNQALPEAQAAVFAQENVARAQGENARAVAAGEAWSFRALEAQFRASPSEYFFRRRLETLEAGLAKRPYSILDSRFERDGGEVWLER